MGQDEMSHKPEAIENPPDEAHVPPTLQQNYDINLVELSLRDIKLHTIGSELDNLKQLRALDVSHNSLSDLPENLKHLPLKSLNASHNSFEWIPDVILDWLPQLTVLDMSHNNLCDFNHPPRCINVIVNFNVSSNDLNYFPHWVFHPMCKIQHLDVSNNPFSQAIWPLEPGRKNTTLKTINVNSCLIRDVEFLEPLMALEEIDIGNRKWEKGSVNLISNNIKDSDLACDAFGRCKKLVLANLGLAVLPDIISQWTNLILLDLSHNLIQWLPESISHLKRLETLVLSNNTLFSLPNSIITMKSLTTLRLDGNKLDYLPENMGDLTNLKHLDVYDNNLTSLQSILKLNLETLDMELNYIEDAEKSKVEGHVLMKNELRRIFNATKRDNGSKRPPTPVSDPEDSDNTFDSRRYFSNDEDDDDDVAADNAYHSTTRVSPVDWELDELSDTDTFDPTNYFPLRGKPNPRIVDLTACPALAHVGKVTSWRDKYKTHPYLDIIDDGQFEDAG